MRFSIVVGTVVGERKKYIYYIHNNKILVIIIGKRRRRRYTYLYRWSVFDCVRVRLMRRRGKRA